MGDKVSKERFVVSTEETVPADHANHNRNLEWPSAHLPMIAMDLALAVFDRAGMLWEINWYVHSTVFQDASWVELPVSWCETRPCQRNKSALQDFKYWKNKCLLLPNLVFLSHKAFQLHCTRWGILGRSSAKCAKCAKCYAPHGRIKALSLGLPLCKVCTENASNVMNPEPIWSVGLLFSHCSS